MKQYLAPGKLSISAVIIIAVSLGTALAQTEISYWLWDSNQQPAYQQCADEFTAANPDISVTIVQQGWDDYWTGITTGFVSGTAPDVFTNHLAKYPEFALNQQVVDVQPWVERDNVDTDIYAGDLAELWTKDGARYGLPKDFDTIAVMYNQEMLDAGGVTVEELDSATWNPEDGGTFGEIIARLSLDADGNNGLSPDFDASNVVQYGYLSTEDADAYGQTSWSLFAASTGWEFNNGLWGDQYNFDDPRFIATIQWFADLVEKGFAPGYELVSTTDPNALFSAGQGALSTDGSWLIGTYLDNSDFEVGFASIPAGPEGKRSMFNGLADSIWTGSSNQDAAWEWVKYAASAACEEVVGASAVVFPAIPSATEIAVQARAEQGVNVEAFTDLINTEGQTFLFPVTDNAAEINDIMTSAMQSVLLGQEDAATALPAANEKINALF